MDKGEEGSPGPTRQQNENTQNYHITGVQHSVSATARITISYISKFNILALLQLVTKPQINGKQMLCISCITVCYLRKTFDVFLVHGHYALPNKTLITIL